MMNGRTSGRAPFSREMNGRSTPRDPRRNCSQVKRLDLRGGMHGSPELSGRPFPEKPRPRYVERRSSQALTCIRNRRRIDES